MEKQLYIIKNAIGEGPGLLDPILRVRGIPYEVIDLDLGQALPDLDSVKALIVLGAPDSANDQSNKIINDVNFVRHTLEEGIPYLGICLGLQVMVKAMGGTIIKNPVKEVGFRGPDHELFKIELNEAGKADPLFSGLEQNLNVFQLHGETVEINASFELLATGKFCANQVVKYADNAYGIQPHFELTPEMFRDWCEHDTWLKELNAEELETDYNNLKQNYTNTGLTLFRNFLALAGY